MASVPVQSWTDRAPRAGDSRSTQAVRATHRSPRGSLGVRSRTKSRASHRGSVVPRWERWMGHDESQEASSNGTAVLAPSGQGGGEWSAGARGWARLRKASGSPFWSHPTLRQGLGDDGRAGGVTRWQTTDKRGGSGGGEKAHSPSSRPAGSGSLRPLSGPARSWACEVRPPWRLAPPVHSAAAP